MKNNEALKGIYKIISCKPIGRDRWRAVFRRHDKRGRRKQGILLEKTIIPVSEGAIMYLTCLSRGHYGAH